MPIKKLNDGLIGLKITDNRAVMAEINCDTDFVAFNSTFISLMGNTLRSCHNMLANHRFLDDYNKVLLILWSTYFFRNISKKKTFSNQDTIESR